MGVAIRDILLDYRKSVGWEELSGVAAVDAHNALYQFLSIIRQPDGTPLMDSRGRITSHLSGILFRSLNFIEKGIKPVYIFDGTPPQFKSETVEQRREVRREADVRWREALAIGDMDEAYKQARSSSRIDDYVRQSAKELLTLMGIPWVEAPSEGEAQAAWMVERGDATYTVSQDYDALLFGSPLLVRNLTVSGRRKVRGRSIVIAPERIVLSELLEGLQITREDLINIGILVGTDFNAGVRGIGPKTALKLAQRGEVEAAIRENLPDENAELIREFFLHPPVTTEYRLAWEQPDEEKILSMLVDTHDFSYERVKSALQKIRESSGQKTLDRWF
ncbi:MAG TPA: flap endonuclease-1 [Methanomicrobiales archaeon]|nr:flap endonuclease-1 [Methanomicrobiales archaeon]